MFKCTVVWSFCRGWYLPCTACISAIKSITFQYSNKPNNGYVQLTFGFYHTTDINHKRCLHDCHRLIYYDGKIICTVIGFVIFRTNWEQDNMHTSMYMKVIRVKESYYIKPMLVVADPYPTLQSGSEELLSTPRVQTGDETVGSLARSVQCNHDQISRQ